MNVGLKMYGIGSIVGMALGMVVTSVREKLDDVESQEEEQKIWNRFEPLDSTCLSIPSQNDLLT
jgi:hypothetical protein